MTRVLILNGSPRKDGNISRMLRLAEYEALQQGAEVTVVSISDLHITPCRGCMICRTKNQCVLPDDDAQHVAGLISRHDALVIGSPCYWGNMPGTFKILFDRIVYSMTRINKYGIPEPLHKEKRAVIIVTCSTPFPFNILFRQSRGALHAFREILKCSGFRNIAALEKSNTRKHSELTRQDETKCRKAIRKLLQK